MWKRVFSCVSMVTYIMQVHTKESSWAKTLLSIFFRGEINYSFVNSPYLGGWVQLQRLDLLNDRPVPPLALRPLAGQHVVRHHLAEAQLVSRGLLLQLSGAARAHFQTGAGIIKKNIIEFPQNIFL